MSLDELAPAKVNLFLHVGRPGADGYHDIASLMVFADVGDRLTLEPGGSGFALTGAFAESLAAETDNLVTRARDRFLTRFSGEADFGLTLDKALPIAAGLGGGSADAAAALRLLAHVRGLPAADRLEPGALGEIARGLGADVAACLGSTAVMASGRGDILQAAPLLPILHGVLVNPRAPSPTAAVYRAFDDNRVWGDLGAPQAPRAATSADVVEWLATTRNDLEAAAIRLCPAIDDVLTALKAAPGCQLARMSGSGATCFAICASEDEALSVASAVMGAEPQWWVAACRFGAPAP